jgi:cytidylate kinase
MKVFDKRPKDMGVLVVVGGPGGSGSSTIAKMLARKYGLHYVYGGQFMRQFAREQGYAELSDFLDVIDDKNDWYKYDKIIDEKVLKMSYKPNVLVDSKVFAALATVKRIPATVKIWLEADVESRVRRTLHKEGKYDLGKSLDKNSKLYTERRDDLMKRYGMDKSRFEKLYGIKYDSPKLYNDIVLDTSRLDVNQTYNLIVRRIEDGGYIKPKSNPNIVSTRSTREFVAA